MDKHLMEKLQSPIFPHLMTSYLFWRENMLKTATPQKGGKRLSTVNAFISLNSWN